MGQAHKPVFISQVYFRSAPLSEGTRDALQQVEQEAARHTLEMRGLIHR